MKTRFQAFAFHKFNLYRYAAGRVKITDFGLSKIMEERAGMGDLSGDTGMELTSQSAVGGCTG